MLAPVARVGTPHMRLERAGRTVGVGVVVEVVWAAAGAQRHQRGAVLAPAHHAGQQIDLGRVRAERRIEMIDALAQLAHDEEAAVVEEFVGGLWKRAVAPVVAIAKQQLAHPHLVTDRCRRLARHHGHHRHHRRLAQAIGEAEVPQCLAGSITEAAGRLYGQHRQAAGGRLQRSDRLGQRGVKLGRRGLEVDQAQHHDHVYRRQVDARVALRRTMAQRTRPVIRVVAAHIAEQAAARFHAFAELLRQHVEPLGGNAQRHQPGVAERDMVANLGRIGRLAAQRGHLGEVSRRLVGAVHAQHHHTAMRHRVVAGQDHGLQCGRHEGQPLLRLRPALRAGEPGQFVGQQGAQLPAELGGLKLRSVDDGLELFQHRLREANQYTGVVELVGREERREAIQALQGAQR